MGSTHDEQVDREIRESMPPVTVAEANDEVRAMIEERDEFEREQSDRLAEDGTWFVSMYAVSRHYGGPEEGGWWYDWKTFEKVRCTVVGARADALRLASEFNATADEERDGPNRFSVIGGDDETYYVEQRPAEHQSTERPHYE